MEQKRLLFQDSDTLVYKVTSDTSLEQFGPDIFPLMITCTYRPTALTAKPWLFIITTKAIKIQVTFSFCKYR